VLGYDGRSYAMKVGDLIEWVEKIGLVVSIDECETIVSFCECDTEYKFANDWLAWAMTKGFMVVL